jgi:hypothetical protein
MTPATAPAVKKERVDDPEIIALAEKMRIANEARMAQMGQRPIPVFPGPHQMVRPGQPSIAAYYQQRTNAQIRPGAPGAPLQNRAAPPPPLDDESVLDINSKKGRFGWYAFKKEFIPYIFRQVSSSELYYLLNTTIKTCNFGPGVNVGLTQKGLLS